MPQDPCAKFILAGEHFILYGTCALAMPWTSVALRLLPTRHPSHHDPIVAQTWQRARAHFQLPPTRAFPFQIDSSIPQGAGFGSSAALCVALAQQAAMEAEQSPPPEEMLSLATDLEAQFHGRSSGLDPATILARQPLRFQMGQPGQAFSWNLPACGFVLATTREARQTANAVSQVRHFSGQHPALFSSLLTEMHSLLATIEALITGAGKQRTRSPLSRAQELGSLLTRNHQILHTVGVSSAHLESLVQTALDHGAWGAKLTGAGLGGSMLAIASPKQLRTIEKALARAGSTFQTTYQPSAC